MNASYIVINENTLGYQIEGDSMVGVLGGKPQLGGRSNSASEPPFMLSHSDNVRPATRDDFEYFRVSSKGHLN
jgi:hypothetical protein